MPGSIHASLSMAEQVERGAHRLTRRPNRRPPHPRYGFALFRAVGFPDRIIEDRHELSLRRSKQEHVGLAVGRGTRALACYQSCQFATTQLRSERRIKGPLRQAKLAEHQQRSSLGAKLPLVAFNSRRSARRRATRRSEPDEILLVLSHAHTAALKQTSSRHIFPLLRHRQ
jgi:hypothetical protein